MDRSSQSLSPVDATRWRTSPAAAAESLGSQGRPVPARFLILCLTIAVWVGAGACPAPVRAASGTSETDLAETGARTSAAADDASAPEAPEEPMSWWRQYFDVDYWQDWYLGVATIVAQHPYEGDPPRVVAFPVPSRLRDYTFTRQRIVGREGLGMLRLYQPGAFEFSVVGSFDSRGFDPDDSDALAGMEKRKSTLTAGVGGAWRGKDVFVEALVMTDLLGRSNGQTYMLSAGMPRRFRNDRLELIPHVDLVYHSASAIDHFYGVRPEEARPGRPAYEGPGTTNIRLTTRGSYRFDGPWALSGRVTFTLFGTGITDSPIVDKGVGWVLALTVMRRLGGAPEHAVP